MASPKERVVSSSGRKFPTPRTPYRRFYLEKSGVFVEAAAGFPSQPPCRDIFLQQRTRAIFRIAESLEEHVKNIDANIEPDEIRQLERPHRMIHSRFHHCVHGLGRRHTFHHAE